MTDGHTAATTMTASSTCSSLAPPQCEVIDLFTNDEWLASADDDYSATADSVLPPPTSSTRAAKPVQLLVVLQSYEKLQHQQQTITDLLHPLHLNYTYAARPLYQHAKHHSLPTDIVTLTVDAAEIQRTTEYLQQYADRIKHVTIDRQLDSSHLKQYASHTDDSYTWLPADSVVSKLHAQQIWQDGHTGQHIRVAIFDTGLNSESTTVQSHLHNVVEVTNWTDEPTTDDLLGHGTFVTSLVGSTHKQCPGFAPDAILSVFRVFNQHQLSYSSWFLDAFNYALHSRVDILNLSIGGPDFLDQPFVDKINELAANNIIVISAIGNDGPLSGTLNNPADMMSVIGVGSIDDDTTLSAFSSRGMTTWELPISAFGRVKPDVVTYGKNLRGLSSNSAAGSGLQQCRSLSGTSVASPVVAGMVTLLASSIDPALLSQRINVATLKQALLETAVRLPNYNLYEQGAGRVDLLAAFNHIQTTLPHASALPATLDLTDCPYMWPYCTQPLFHTQMPTVVNITVLNSMCVTSKIQGDSMHFTVHSVEDEATHESMPQHSDVVQLQPTFAPYIYPYSGWLAVAFTVAHDAQQAVTLKATLTVDVTCVDATEATSTIILPVTLRVIPQPPRTQRLLFDQFHSLRYPAAYFPRDNLEVKTDTLDWNGDSLYTNYNDLYNTLRGAGYYVDIVTTDYTCVDFRLYSTLLLIDPEEEYFSAERSALHTALSTQGLSLLVFADWYNTALMQDIKFYDENTQSWWIPETGGSNVPALNDLLAPYDLAFSHHVVKGPLQLCKENVYYASGTTVARAPKSSRLLPAKLLNMSSKSVPPQQSEVFVGALLDLVGEQAHATAAASDGQPQRQAGRLALYGDSNCIDTAHRQRQPCTQFLLQLLNYTSTGHLPAELNELFEPPVTSSYDDDSEPAARMVGNNLERYSRVIKHGSQPACTAGQPLSAASAPLYLQQHVAERVPAVLPGHSVADEPPSDLRSVDPGFWLPPEVLQPVGATTPLITSGLFLPLIGLLLLLTIVGHAYRQYRLTKRLVSR